jgi:RNA polymerase sigma-70 factor (ECF subfamily)
MRAADGKLVERLRAAGEEAVEELVGRYAGLLHRAALRITGTAVDAGAVTWDVMQTAWPKIAGFRGEAALSSWMYRIAANAAYGKGRARNAPTVPLDLEDALRRPAPPESSVATPTERPAGCENPAGSRGALRRERGGGRRPSPADYRAVLVLGDMEGLPKAEIADVLGLNTVAVTSRAHRARRALRERLAGCFEGRSA